MEHAPRPWRVPRQRAICLILGLFFASPALRAAPGPDAAGPLDNAPDDAQLEEQGAVIGEIVIDVRNIFNPELPTEDRRLFRLANRAHRTTRDGVIESQLLFKVGDVYSRRLLDESERLLRKNRYLYDAEIRPIGVRNGLVVVEVTTRDVWTLKPSIGIGRSGGANSTRFELQDSNFLGTGKALTFEHQANVDRSTSAFRYDDHNVFGSRLQLSALYSSNSDGDSRRLDVARPFYSLDTRWAAGLTAFDETRTDSLYALGHIQQQFRHQLRQLEVSGGLSRGLDSNGLSRRWGLGFTYQEDTFQGLGTPLSSGPLPADRTLSYPWVSFELVGDRFVKERNLNQLQRTEDIELGTQVRARLGWSSPLFSADRNEAVFALSASQGLRLSERQTLTLEAASSGRFTGNDPHNLLWSASARYYLRDFADQLFFTTLEYAAGERLDGERQILLGGDNGLRGYPLRYQTGESRALLTVEQRVFTSWHPLQLFHVGAAAFFDIGRTWDPDDITPDRALGHQLSQGWLRDVGVGLRLSSSRSGLGNVIHIDLAFPLDGDGSIDRIQYLVTTHTSF